ncbi:13268_t:CDS:10 [Gigaspora rosea]|nr:13268_t:CDS:10 [Gigaspora rosea]
MDAFKPAGRIYQASIIIENKIYFLGGLNSANISTNDLFYLDISSPFSSIKLEWTDLTSIAPIPVKSAFSPACVGGINNSTIYLFEHRLTDNVNSTTLVTFTFDLTSQKWNALSKSEITPPPRQNMKAVVDMNGKMYINGGYEPYTTFKSNNNTYIFNSLSNSWLNDGPNSPVIRSAYTATLLPSGLIVYIGGIHDFPNGVYPNKTEDYHLVEIDMKQISIYNTISGNWSSMEATGDLIGTRLSHTAVLSKDGTTIIIYGGGSGNFTVTPEPSLAALDTRVKPYKWSNISNDQEINIPLIAGLSSGLFALIIIASIIGCIFYKRRYNYIATPGTNTGELNYIATPGTDTGDRCYIATPGTDISDRKYIATPGTDTDDHKYIATPVICSDNDDAVFQIPTESDQSITSISSALQRIFCRLNISDTAVEATELTKFFGWNKFFMDIDIRKFIRILFDDLENKMKNTKVDGTISKYFVGTKKIYIKCINVDYESIRFEEYSDIQLNVNGCSTLEESFDNYVEETLEGDNKYEAEEYGLQVAKKKVIFESLPPVLHIHLNWFEYDAKDDCMIELNHHYEFPMEIDLQKYLSSDVSDVSDVDKLKSHKYLLHGVIVRHRSSKNRYFAWLKTGKNWTKFIDERVTVASIENNYNGDDNNTYMLIYIRESCVDEILSPINYKDIPKHLCEQRQKVLKYNSMYINVEVVTEEIFKNHKGYGLKTLAGPTNFDNYQYPLTEIHKFEILEELTYGTFKKMASERFKIPSNKMRFWKIINNPDGTNRLRAIINGKLFFDKPMKEIIGASGRLYMELLDKPINNRNESFMIFLKYFNPDAQLLNRGLGHLYVRKSSKISSIFHIIRKKNQLPQNTSLEAYEEKSWNMIKIQPSHIFKDFIQNDGAIICFQKELTSEEIQEHLSVDRIYSIPKFYELLSMNTTIMFRSKFGYKDPIPAFSLILNRNMKFSTIANQVAVHINIDPLRLHFMPEANLPNLDINSEIFYKNL